MKKIAIIILHPSNLKAALFLALIHPHLISDRRTRQFYLTRQKKRKKKLKQNVPHFFRSARWKVDMQLRRSWLRLYYLPPKETVCQSNGAPSQTSPGVRCYCASSTMLHCSLHIAYPPQRGRGFNKETMGVRWSPLSKNNAADFMWLRRAFMWRRGMVMTRWEVSNNCILPSARIKPNLCLALKSPITNLDCARGGVLPIFVIPE